MKISLLFIAWLSCFASIAQGEKVSFEALDSLLQKAPRSTVIFIKAPWCRYCHAMENTTLQDKKVQEILANYYFVGMNGEGEKDIRFAGHTFSHIQSGPQAGTHALALELGSINGRLSYPTLVVMNAEMEVVFQHSGFLNTEELRAILTSAEH